MPLNFIKTPDYYNFIILLKIYLKEGVKRSELVESWGDFKADKLSLDDIAANHEEVEAQIHKRK